MSHPVTPVLFVVRSKTNTKPLSKTIRYFFVMLHVVFALDFGFIQFKSTRFNIVIKLLTFSHSSAVFLYLSLTTISAFGFVSSYFNYLLVYYIFTLILLFSKTTYCEYLSDLHLFDAEIEVDSFTYRLEYKMMIWFIVLIVYRIVMTLGYCAIYNEDCPFSLESVVLYNTAMVGMDTVMVVYTFTFYNSYKRMVMFAVFIKNGSKDVVSCQYLYKNFVEVVERIKKLYDFMLILIMATNTIDVILTIYIPFVQDILTEDPLGMSVTYVIVVQELLMLFSPAITAGLLARQVERLRLVLYDKMIQDKTRRKDITRFAAYLKERPLRFRIWRVIPLDWRLPAIVINIAFTYLIVMIQFTH